MKESNYRSGIFIPPGRKVWPHEDRVAKILAMAGYYVEFLEETNLKTADILLNGIPYEIKSPKTISTNTLEHLLKKGLRQCPNLIIDTSRTKMRDDKMRIFLTAQMRKPNRLRKC